MSAQFGRWNLDGEPPCRQYIEKAASALAPYAPDGQKSYRKGGLAIVYSAFHTTHESRKESQPFVCKSGAVITWNGRLDNGADLRRELRLMLETDSPDILTVAAAYEQWGEKVFAKLIGDWALSIWKPDDPSLILATDPIGTRHLYYSHLDGHLTWSSLLDPLILLADRFFDLSGEYVAGWMSSFPSTHLTPYVGIRSVPPSSFIRVTRKGLTTGKYWDFDPCKKISYGTDVDYEEHFRSVFRQAVRRRVRSDTPIMAELSGGMDSSSIVCMADTILRSGGAEAPRLDTLSYYNDDEPNWNERPYFEKVEERIGRTGCHIGADGAHLIELSDVGGSFCASPARLPQANSMANHLATRFKEHGNRVLLSGIGGDEVAGGVPTALPEIADLLATVRVRDLWMQLGAWALAQRRPWCHLLLEAAGEFLPPSMRGRSSTAKPTTWLTPRFAAMYPDTLAGYPARLVLLGPHPSFQDNLMTLDALRRQLACLSPSCGIPVEYRYPFLDRDFLEFIYAIPRSQVVRPGQRRSLMRRALISIVPREILERRRKAFVVRGPMAAIAKHLEPLMAMTSSMVSEQLGFVDSRRFAKTLGDASLGLEVPLVSIVRTVQLEMWLRGLSGRGIVRQLGLGERGPHPAKTLQTA